MKTLGVLSWIQALMNEYRKRIFAESNGKKRN